MKKIIWVVGSVILVSGCATQGVSTANYEKNTSTSMINEVMVSESYSLVWDKLVRELSKSYFVINNIDKESRIINLSFTSKTPTEFVDCGKTQRTYKQGEKLEVFNYETAGKGFFKVPTARQEHPAFSNYILVKRDPTLEGRTNVYLAPSGSDSAKTLVTVNTRYILNISVQGQGFAEHINGNTFTRGFPNTDVSVISFNTNKPGDSTGSGSETIVTCFSKGVLERDILKLVQ